MLLVFGWFLSGGDAPDYLVAEDWTDWAGDNRLRSGIGAFLILLAGIAMLHFAGTIRSVLGTRRYHDRPVGSVGSLPTQPGPPCQARH